MPSSFSSSNRAVELVVVVFLHGIVPCHAALLFVIGGNTHTGYLKSVDVYDTERATWTSVADMPAGRASFGAAAVNGRVYAIGGLGEASSASVVSFDPKANSWSSAASMRQERIGFGVAELDGKIYALGGCCGLVGVSAQEIQTAEMFDPETNTWTSIKDMPTKRDALAAAAFGERVYAVGGSRLNSVDEYNTKNQTWSPVTPMGCVHNHHCAAVLGNKIYAIGAYSRSNDTNAMKCVEVYDRESREWSRVASMSTVRSHCGAVAVNGLLYVVGGRSDSVLEDTVELDTIEVYDPSADTWSILPARMPTPRSHHAVVLLAN